MLAQLIRQRILERKSLLKRKNDPTNNPIRHKIPNRPYRLVTRLNFGREIPQSQYSAAYNSILVPRHILRYRLPQRRSRLQVTKIQKQDKLATKPSNWRIRKAIRTPSFVLMLTWRGGLVTLASALCTCLQEMNSGAVVYACAIRRLKLKSQI